jgi:hypothetical protein
MKIKNLYPLLLILSSVIVFQNCTTKTNQEDLSSLEGEGILDLTEEKFYQYAEKFEISSEHELLPAKEINISLDSSSLFFSTYPVYFDADTAQYYVTANELLHCLEFYDLGRKKLFKRVYFEKEGNKGISSIRRFFVKSLDSIFIYSPQDLKLVLTDVNAELKSNYKLPREYINKVHAHLGSPFYVNNKDEVTLLYFPFLPNNMCYDSLTQFTFNLSKERAKVTGVNFPKAVTDQEYVHSHAFPRIWPASTSNQNITIFPMIPGLFLFDQDKESFNYFPIRSKLGSGFRPLPSLNKNGEGGFRDESILRDGYTSCLYDKYRKVYYLIFTKGRELFDVNGSRATVDDKVFSIIILDESFNSLGETILKENKYFRNFLVTKEGLLVSNANPKNVNLDEDILSFTLFKLSE